MLKPCKKDKKGQRRRPWRVVKEEEDEDGREKGQAGSDAKSPPEVEKSFQKEIILEHLHSDGAPPRTKPRPLPIGIAVEEE